MLSQKHVCKRSKGSKTDGGGVKTTCLYASPCREDLHEHSGNDLRHAQFRALSEHSFNIWKSTKRKTKINTDNLMENNGEVQVFPLSKDAGKLAYLVHLATELDVQKNRYAYMEEN